MPQHDNVSWALHIDESGSFGSVEDPVSIAGVLIRSGLPGSSPGEIRQSLEQLVPELPWPFHATHLRQLAYVALVLNERFDFHEDHNPALRPALDEANVILDDRCKESVQMVRSQLHEFRRPSIDTLRPMTKMLRAHLDPTNLAILDEFSRRAWVAVRRLFTTLHTTAGQSIRIVAASETALGDAYSTERSHPEDDRYYELLECLLRRTALLLEPHASCSLFVRVLRRGVFDPRFGKNVELDSHHVNEIIKNVPSKTVRLIADMTRPFDQDTWGEFVLADFVANQSRRILKHETASLHNRELLFQDYFAVSLRSGTPEQSHLSASGAAKAFLETSDPRLVSDPVEAFPWSRPRRRWACEQAWEIKKAARGTVNDPS